MISNVPMSLLWQQCKSPSKEAHILLQYICNAIQTQETELQTTITKVDKSDNEVYVAMVTNKTNRDYLLELYTEHAKWLLSNNGDVMRTVSDGARDHIKLLKVMEFSIFY